MELFHFLGAVRRLWWLVLGLPLLALILAFILTPKQPFETSFRATVLIPGDTEDTGSAERPELMVLDDLPSLVGSEVFANATLQRMKSAGYIGPLDVGAVKEALSGSRYSRVLTVTVASDHPADARTIASAASQVLPAEVNAYLVADRTKPATVQLIDPPGEPVRGTTRRYLQIAVETFAAFCVAIAIVALIEGVRNLMSAGQPPRRRRTAPDTVSSEAPTDPAR